VAATDQSTHFGWSFSDFNSETDVILFSIRPTTGGGSDVVRLQFRESDPTGYTISPNLFQAGVDYTGQLTFARIVDNPDDITDVSGVAFFSMETTFNIQAVPEPSTYAMMGFGLLGIVFWMRRRAAISNRDQA
jgi:hypothetical protein